MNTVLALAMALTIASEPVEPAPPAHEPAPPSAAALNGPWSVDLSTDPAEPYRQPMMLTVSADGRVSGSFYSTPISSGRLGRNQGRLCVAFVTSDGVGDYQHSACLVDGRMIGQSWAEHRQFVLPWVAERAPR